MTAVNGVYSSWPREKFTLHAQGRFQRRIGVLKFRGARRQLRCSDGHLLLQSSVQSAQGQILGMQAQRQRQGALEFTALDGFTR
jgi:hypothetical protein